MAEALTSRTISLWWRRKQGLAPESCAWWIFTLKHEGAKSDDWRWGDRLELVWRFREIWSDNGSYTFEPTWKEVEGDSIYDFKVNFDVGQGKMRELADERYRCLQICRETCKVGAWSQKDVVGMGVLFVLARCRILMDKKCPWTSTMARLSWSSTLPVNEANMSPMISHDSPAQPSRASRPMLFPRFLHTFARSDEVKLCWTVPTQMLFPEIDLSLNCLKFHNLFQNFTKSRIEFFRAFFLCPLRCELYGKYKSRGFEASKGIQFCSWARKVSAIKIMNVIQHDLNWRLKLC